MSRALVSPTPGDSDKPSSSVFIPPPIQRLSRSLTGFTGLVPSKSQSPPDPASNLPSQSSSPLPGPNRAPTTAASPYPQPSSSKPSNTFPRLHRLEIADDMARNQTRAPLLDLKLSSPSFLDAVATDVDSDKPIYAVETVGSSTTIWRSDPWEGSAKIADIRWPKDLPLKGKGRDHTHSPTVQMDGVRWRDTASLLKQSGLGSSRKFHIPYHPHALKWKQVGDMYMCTTPTCKGAVATLESFTTDTAPRLKVFETLGSLHRSVPQLEHAGISLSLLDHLFVTALLLITEPEDWMTVARNPTSFDSRSADTASSFKTPASARQWRKIMYGEPLYPSLKMPAFEKVAVNGSEDADVLDISEPPQLSTSIRQWRKIVYGEPLYPSLRPQSVDGVDLPPRPSTATSFSSESAYSPPTPSSAPSTGFYDTLSLFDDSERINAPNGTENRQVASPIALSPGPISPVPSSECIPLSAVPSPTRANARRELPSPPSSYQPPPSIQPWLHRSRSSPRLSHSACSPITPVDAQDNPNEQSLLTRISSGLSVRQLPTIPPLRESPVQSLQAQTRLMEAKRLSQPHQRTLPPTPASISKSSVTEQYHVQSHSQAAASQSPTSLTLSWPSTGQPGPSVVALNDVTARGPRERLEKDPDEVIHWMRNITRAHRRRALDGDDENHVSGPYDAAYEPPPPAYNAIDFSTPPQARSPQGAQR